MKLLRKSTLVLSCLMAVLLPSSLRAAPTQAQLIQYTKNAWELTDLTDEVISQTLDTSYSGIPFKEYVSFFIVAPEILNPLASGDYKTAGKKAADFAVDQSISYLLTQAGLSGVVAPAKLAAWPIEHSLNLFRQAVQEATFKNQIKLYFAARSAGNSYDAIANLPNFELMPADADILGNGRDLVTKIEGWLAFSTSYLVGSVPGYIPAEFYDYAEQQWQSHLASDNYSADQATVQDAFRAAAAPQRPVITQQPQDAVIASGGNATFVVAVTGTAPFQYVWDKDGVAFAGPYGATFTASTPGGDIASLFMTPTSFSPRAASRLSRSIPASWSPLPPQAPVPLFPAA